MALSLKDWQLPNSRIWLAEIDIDRGLDFPIKTGLILRWKSSKLNYENVHHFLLFFFSQSFMEVPKSLMTKKSKEDEHVSAGFS